MAAKLAAAVVNIWLRFGFNGEGTSPVVGSYVPGRTYIVIVINNNNKAEHFPMCCCQRGSLEGAFKIFSSLEALKANTFSHLPIV